MEVKFLKVDMDILREFGAETAIFYAYLVFIGRKLKKDDHGYFCFDAKYACRGLGWDRGKFRYARDLVVKANLIEYIGGSNQNQKPRYRIK